MPETVDGDTVHGGLLSDSLRLRCVGLLATCFDGSDQSMPVATRNRPWHAFEIRDCLVGTWAIPCDCKQHVVGDGRARRQIFVPSNLIPHLYELSKDSSFDGPESASAFDLPLLTRQIGEVPLWIFEGNTGRIGPLLMTIFGDPASKEVVQHRQVPHVIGGVPKLTLRERPRIPCGERHARRRRRIDHALNRLGQRAWPWEASQTAEDLRIDDRFGGAAKQAGHDLEVLPPGVYEHDSIWGGKHLKQRAQIPNGKGIDQIHPLPASDLHEAELWVVGLLADEFGVVGHQFMRCEMRDNFSEPFLILNQRRWLTWNIGMLRNRTQCL